jgi:hypothetical protein
MTAFFKRIFVMKLIPSPTHDTPDSPQIVFSPAVRIDASMQVLYANPAARMAGIGTGDTLILRHGTCERLRHEACFHRSPLTRYDPLGSPQNAALFALENTGPFRIAYVEYTYTFHQCRAIAVLFRTRQEYLRFAAALDRGPRRYCGMLLHTLRSLRDQCRQQLTQPDTQPPLAVDTVEELMTIVRTEKGRIEAPPGGHDDLMMALAIAHHIRQQAVLPETDASGEVSWFAQGFRRSDQTELGEIFVV